MVTTPTTKRPTLYVLNEVPTIINTSMTRTPLQADLLAAAGLSSGAEMKSACNATPGCRMQINPSFSLSIALSHFPCISAQPPSRSQCSLERRSPASHHTLRTPSYQSYNYCAERVIRLANAGFYLSSLPPHLLFPPCGAVARKIFQLTLIT